MSFRNLKYVFAVFTVLIFGIPALADDATNCTDNGGAWDNVQQICLIAGSGQNAAGIDYSYEVHYPASIADEPFITSALNGAIQSLIDSFITAAEGETSSPGDLFLNTTFDLYEHDADIFSVVFTISDYLGGAHPNSYFRTFTFHRSSQQQLSLLSLFNDANALMTIEPIVVADLQAQLGNDAGTIQWIQDGTGQDVNNYRNFAVDTDHLIFFFDPYQVAPYAAGPQTVTIPIADLASIWSPGAVSTSCAGSLPARLAIGDRGRIASVYSTLRAQAAGTPIKVVYAPASFDVLQGPLCAGYGPLTWFEIEYDDGSRGWASESQVSSIWGPNQYWLEPVPVG